MEVKLVQEDEAVLLPEAVRGAGPDEDEEEDVLDVAEEFREFAKYVEDNLRTQVDRERTQAGEAAVDFLTELADGPDEVAAKVRQLAALVRAANHFVIYTGAGISTAAGLPGITHTHTHTHTHHRTTAPPHHRTTAHARARARAHAHARARARAHAH
jgi:hypothetical protein